MKVSYNWIKQLVDFDLPPIDELVEKIGAQLGGVEEVINLGERYQGIVIVKVMKCEPLEGSDHLSVCRVDDGGVVKDVERGDDGLVQVVCGAPNCTEGILVAWLPPGSTVPASYDEDERFVLSARELRGAKSNGMLASPKELAIGDSHEGLLLLNPHDAKPGADFAETYRLKGEYIIEIENKMFTHRPDCFGMLGVAREIAGILGKPFHSQPWYIQSLAQLALVDNVGNSLPLTVTNEIPELVPRFLAVSLAGVSTSMPSLPWMATMLNRVGIRPINLVVDLTNYCMVLTGQPMHAYDYDKVKALSNGDSAHIVVRMPHDKEKLTLLSGKEITPRAEAILIASDKAAIGLGGVMGSANSDIDEKTQNIILESATFDMYSIRRTSMEHGIFTDAVTRFNKGQSPLQNDKVLAYAVGSLCQYSDDTVSIESSFIDDNHLSDEILKRNSLYPAVKVSAEFINQRLGSELSAGDMAKLLENTEFTVEAKDENLVVTAPFWRTDIELREDIVEEVGRLYGYDRLPLELPQRDISPAVKNALLEAKDQIRLRLARAGANEVLTYSFVHGDLLQKTGQDPEKAFKLSNALSPDLQYYRLSLIPSLLEKVHPNIKAGYDQFALFEIGKTHGLDHIDDDGLPIEHEFTALVVTANDKLKKVGAAYYEARLYLENLAGMELEFKPVGADMQAYPVVQPYDPNRSAMVSIKGGDFLGIIGEFKASVARSLKLPKYTAGFEVDTTVLQAVLAHSVSYIPLSRFPKVTQDITLKIPVSLTHQDLINFFWQEYKDQEPGNVESTLSSLDIYQAPEDDTHKNVTLHFTIASYERTLTDADVNKLLENIATAAKAKFGAERL